MRVVFNLPIRVAANFSVGHDLWGICNPFGLKREVRAGDLELGTFNMEDRVGHKCH